jgi:hypothetical protein
MWVGLLILIIFVATALLMFFRKLPAILALPLMAFAIAGGTALITGDISFRDLMAGVLAEGALRLNTAIVVAFFGGMLSFMMQKSGVAERFVKQGAELVGDSPWGVSLFVMGLVAILFTTIGGLGAIIMVATIVLPVLATVGVPPIVAGGIFLIGLSLGGILNAANWVLYVDVMRLPTDVVKRFALVLFALVSITGVIFVTVELYRSRLLLSMRRVLGYAIGTIAVALAAVVLLVGWGGNGVVTDSVSSVANKVGNNSLSLGGWLMFGIRWLVGLFFFWIFAQVLLRTLRQAQRWHQQVVEIKWYAYLIPVVPLLLILLYDFPILAAFVMGLIYAVIVTLRPGSINMTVQSMIEGGASVMPAVMLIIGIGILISAVLGPSGWSEAHNGQTWPVLTAIQPLFQTVVPSSFFTYVLGFGVAAPLALYRGPLNVWGLGFGLATMLMSSGGLPPAAIMAMLLTVGQVQGICDPTNTHNVWLANELRVDVQALLWRTLPYVWGMTFVGLLVAGVWYLW